MMQKYKEHLKAKEQQKKTIMDALKSSLTNSVHLAKQSRMKSDEMAWKLKLQELGKTVPDIYDRKKLIL